MMVSILRRGNPHEKTREKTRVKPREKAPTREVIGKFWVRGNNVNNAARARPCAAGNVPFSRKKIWGVDNRSLFVYIR